LAQEPAQSAGVGCRRRTRSDKSCHHQTGRTSPAVWRSGLRLDCIEPRLCPARAAPL